MNIVMQPVKRIQLRDLAVHIRETLKLQNELRFPVLFFLETYMPLMFEGFHFEIVEKEELGNEIHAQTDIVNRCIKIREDVYEGAVKRVGRDRMTVAHEIAHYVLLVVCGLKFNRCFEEKVMKPYEDPEWQAKALAGELLCPAHLIRRMTAEEIARQCGVSLAAARTQLKTL